MARQPKITIACGRRATGKSIETVEQIYKYVNGNPALGITGRKALIYDVNDEFGNFKWKDGTIHSIKRLNFSDIPAFTLQPVPEVRRIAPYWDDGRRLTISDMSEGLGIILNHYRDGLLLVEDINKYTNHHMKQDLIGSLATIRQARIDLVAHYQLVGMAASPKIIGMTNYIRLHKTFDSIEKHKTKFADKAEIMQLAENIVDRRYTWGMKNNINDESGKFFSLYVDMEYGKIKGIFSEQEAKDAIQKYIGDGSAIRKMLNQRDRKGKKIYNNYEQAYNELESSLYTEYFSF